MLNLQSLISRTGRPLIMGIVNATGDSFSEGKNSVPATAPARALALLADGADWLDIGGESTRPGATPCSPEEEWARIEPVLRMVKRSRPEVLCSIDTRHAAVAAAALAAGADLVNDVSMLREAPEIAVLTAKYGAGLILCHSRGTPADMASPEHTCYPDGVVSGVRLELETARELALGSGVLRDNLLLDPGIGFAKTAAQSWELLRHWRECFPPEETVIGVSRKSFLREIAGIDDPLQRDIESLAVELHFSDAAVIRTHSPGILRRALAVKENLK